MENNQYREVNAKKINNSGEHYSEKKQEEKFRWTYLSP